MTCRSKSIASISEISLGLLLAMPGGENQFYLFLFSSTI